ncbi:MAG TPA: Uma2 family endonuclease [Beijerinckiaceae bacterium]|jgi:Uma2 family endonuclease
MTGAAVRKPPLWTVDFFRSWVESRPDEERWELIDGVAVLMTPPTIAHQRIGSNLEQLLNDALEKHDPSRLAFQRLGIDLTPAMDNYQPEPDVVVMDAEFEPEQRYVQRFYLAAEVISASDSRKERKGDEVWAEKKRAVYRDHPSCLCVLLIEQDRYEVRLDVRTEAGWTSRTLRDFEDVIDLSAFGLTCRVADLYKGTPLGRRPAARR